MAARESRMAELTTKEAKDMAQKYGISQREVRKIAARYDDILDTFGLSDSPTGDQAEPSDGGLPL